MRLCFRQQHGVRSGASGEILRRHGTIQEPFFKVRIIGTRLSQNVNRWISRGGRERRRSHLSLSFGKAFKIIRLSKVLGMAKMGKTIRALPCHFRPFENERSLTGEWPTLRFGWRVRGYLYKLYL